jgi:peptidoglycan/xylan/chitin deacetylase (PgdA/CDA1 family)
MEKHTTWLACGGVAAGITGSGLAADRALGTTPIIGAAAAFAGGAYLVGTFAQSSLLFGRPARFRRPDGKFSLTFDDGPDPRYTRSISGYLASRGHRATFFVLGRSVAAHPDLAVQLVADGHEIASHGNDHRLLALSPPRAVREQIFLAEQAVREATGRLPVPLFRAPHGVRSPWLVQTLRARGYRLCGWHGRVFDTSRPGVATIVERVTQILQPGAVVLLHDGDGSGRGAPRDQTAAALPEIIGAADALGLRSVPLSTLVG